MIKRILFDPIFVAAVLLMVVLPASAAADVQVSLTSSSSELTVGDPVHITLDVNHPAGYQVIIPQLEGVWGDLEVRSQSQTTTMANEDGTETTSQTVEVTAFNLGDVSTAELPLTISDGAGTVTEEVVPALSLTVIPTLAEDDTTLRDIKPQAALAIPATWPQILGGVLLAAALAVGGWWAFRRWQGKRPFGLGPAVDNRPPWQVAYDELARIEGLNLLDQRRFKEYYTLATDCLRTYLEAQFQLRVFDRTTSELMPVLRQSDLSPDHTRRILDLFMESALVKFAKFTPDLETAHKLTGQVRQLVEETRPKPELEALLSEDQQPGSEQGGPPARSPHIGGMGPHSVGTASAEA
jgi:hypothetical protein